MATKKKAVKKVVKKKVPVNPLDNKIIKSITKGRKTFGKIVLSINAMPNEIESRLKALKRQGKIAYNRSQGYFIPPAGYVAPKTAVTPSPVSE